MTLTTNQRALSKRTLLSTPNSVPANAKASPRSNLPRISWFVVRSFVEKKGSKMRVLTSALIPFRCLQLQRGFPLRSEGSIHHLRHPAAPVATASNAFHKRIPNSCSRFSRQHSNRPRSRKSVITSTWGYPCCSTSRMALRRHGAWARSARHPRWSRRDGSPPGFGTKSRDRLHQREATQ